MTARAANQAQTLLDLFARAGFARVETAILQPAAIFVDLSGEDIRRRLFLTQDADGRELCLRPEFTIPVARDHLGSAAAGGRADVSYLGPVFRHRSGETGEFVQAGAESFGRADTEAADAEMLALALEAAAALGLDAPSVAVGDAGMFAAMLDALGLGAGERRRLKRAFSAGRFAAALDPAPAPQSGYAGLMKAIEGQDPKAARAFVEDVLTIAGIERVGGRSAGEIAHRFLRQAGLQGEPTLSPDAADTLRRFAAISGDPDEAALALRALASERKLDLDAAIDRFELRNGFLAADGVDPAGLSFSAAFGRNLDYYTGFVFELRDPARGDGRPLVAGGRYDGLLTALGARAPVQAVGFAMWLDRFARGARA